MIGVKRPKFKSPLNRASSTENNGDKTGQGQTRSSNGSDEPLDERLRNIEPKMIETIKNEVYVAPESDLWFIGLVDL